VKKHSIYKLLTHRNLFRYLRTNIVEHGVCECVVKETQRSLRGVDYNEQKIDIEERGNHN
jgi:hypothetical protein